MVRPLPHNQAIRAVADSRVALELNRRNLELNASPVLLAGRPFTALGAELTLLLDRVSGAARDYSGCGLQADAAWRRKSFARCFSSAQP